MTDIQSHFHCIDPRTHGARADGTAVREPVDPACVQIAPEAYPVTRSLASLTPAYGLYARHTRELRLRDFHATPAPGEVREAMLLD